MNTVDHVASGDCERCRPGLVAQPANTVSSLAYVAAGALILRSSRRRPTRRSEVLVGWAAVAAGLGSIAYHGPGTTSGRYFHDTSLLALVGLVAVADVELASGREAPVAALVGVAAGASLGAHPRAPMAVQSVAGAAAVGGEVARMLARDGWSDAPSRPRRRRLAQGLLAGGGALAHVGGRTGGPWCRPDSLMQPHAVWHVTTAAAIWLRSLDIRAGNIGAIGLHSESPRGAGTR